MARDNEQDPDKIKPICTLTFVPFRLFYKSSWALIPTLILILGGAVIWAIATSSDVSVLKVNYGSQCERITKLEMMPKDLDTVKSLLRDQIHQLKINSITRGVEP
jgi:hypothetical protein